MPSKMESFVITIMDNKKSKAAAERCQKSVLKNTSLSCELFPATTPKDNIKKLFKAEGLNGSKFNADFSRVENCMAAFYSHYSLWKLSAETGKIITIFEHDAVVKENIPDFIPFKGCINLGKPSYGKFKTPKKMGVNPLISKEYFPGAHAYRITSSAAKILVNFAKENAEPTDIYLRNENFKWLEEYYPWPVEVVDEFSTIQHGRGCAAKHGYDKNTYELVEVI